MASDAPPASAPDLAAALSHYDIYDPGRRVNFSGNPAPAITWIDGTHYAWSQNGRGGGDWRARCWPSCTGEPSRSSMSI